MNRFVTPEVVRLPLSGGDWIDVKKELNTGESRRLFARMARDMTPGEKVRLDPEQVGRAKVLEYLMAWSLTDAAGAPVSIATLTLKEAAVDNLQLDTFNEIRDAIEQHEDATTTAREKEKNDQAGESASKPISPSPVAAGGATSGLLN